MITDSEYSNLIVVLDTLLSLAGNNEHHDIMPAIDCIADLIEEYDYIQNL